MRVLKDVKRSIGGWLRNNPDAKPTTMALAMVKAVGVEIPADKTGKVAEVTFTNRHGEIVTPAYFL